MDKIKKIKIQYEDGLLSDEIPFTIDAKDINITETQNLEEKLETIEEDISNIHNFNNLIRTEVDLNHDNIEKNNTKIQGIYQIEENLEEKIGNLEEKVRNLKGESILLKNGNNVDFDLSNKLYVFNTKEEVIDADFLKKDDRFQLLGESSFGDTEIFEYIIRERQSGDEDDKNLILLRNSLTAEKIYKNPLRFHTVAKSSATYIVIFPNKETMFIDTGMADQWEEIKDSIRKLGINYFNYGIITHFHKDHYGNIENFINEYNLNENTKIWIQRKPDFQNHSAEIEDSESVYENQKNIFIRNGITPIVPINDSYFEIDNEIKLHFLNTSSEWETDYYGKIAEYRTENINFNIFSLVTEILYKNINILTTGDIEKPVEEKLYNYIHQCDIITAPHHLVNRDGCLDFYRAAKAKWALGMYISDNNTWLNRYFKSAKFLIENGAKIITPTWSIADEYGCFSFYTDGLTINSTSKGSGLCPDFVEGKVYDRVEEIINWTDKTQEETTLRNVFENMNPGSILNIYIYSQFISQKVKIYEDLKALFPIISGGWVVKIQKGLGWGESLGYSYINATNGYINLIAKQNVNSGFDFKISGYGTLQNIEEENALIEKLSLLPEGNYNCIYKDTQGMLLATNGMYDLSIYKSNSAGSVRCSITAILRDGTSNTHSEGVFAGHYNGADSNPKIRWYRLGNSNYMGLVNGMAELINSIKKLKRGHYIMRYYNDDSGFLIPNGGYDLSIDVSQSLNEDQNITATILATLRSTIPDNPNTVQVAMGYINSDGETDSYVWHKINN